MLTVVLYQALYLTSLVLANLLKHYVFLALSKWLALEQPKFALLVLRRVWN